MNEQVKKLLEQATYDCMGIKQVDQAEFAELLIRECADYIDSFNRKNMVEEGISGDMLKQHFGD